MSSNYYDQLDLLYDEVIESANPSNREHCIFISRLFLSLTTREPDAANACFHKHEKQIDSLISADRSQHVDWAKILDRLGEKRLAMGCLQTALPETPGSAQLLIDLLVKYGQLDEALMRGQQWLDAHPDDTSVRTRYLSLVEKNSTPELVKNTIEETGKWLNDHPDETSVRTRYLSLVEKNSTPELVKNTIEETGKWLNDHLDDTSVRTRYLLLVEQKGTTELVQKVVEETGKWLNAHPDDTFVRTRYLSLVEQKGTTELVQKVVEETGKWLNDHPDNNNVRTRYLSLVEQKGTTELVQKVVEETGKWLNDHPDDNNVRTRYLSLVEQKGTTELVQKVVEETGKWLNDHPDDNNVRTRYLSLVEQKGTTELVQKVVEETGKWLNDHPDDTYVRTCYLSLVEQKGTPELVKNVVEETGKWLNEHLHSMSSALTVFSPYFAIAQQHQAAQPIIDSCFELLIPRHINDNVFQTSYATWLAKKGEINTARSLFSSLVDKCPHSHYLYYSYGHFLLTLGEFKEAENMFRRAIAIHRGHEMAIGGLAKAFIGFGKEQEKQGNHNVASKYYVKAESELRLAIYWARVHGQPSSCFFISLGWLYIDLDRHSSAIQAFTSGLAENPDNFAIYWGLGGDHRIALGELGSAKQNLETALQKAPSGLDLLLTVKFVNY